MTAHRFRFVTLSLSFTSSWSRLVWPVRARAFSLCLNQFAGSLLGGLALLGMTSPILGAETSATSPDEPPPAITCPHGPCKKAKAASKTAAAPSSTGDSAARSTPAHDDGSVVHLDTMTISSEVPEMPVFSTVNIKANLGAVNDGAELLKQTPGISLIRQGGTASDPLYRGLGGSRLTTMIDGVPFGGACNHRMDPATAYVKPGTFKSFDLLQGPQSVRQGNTIAGAVKFEREKLYFKEPGFKTYASYLYGSFNRQDITSDGSFGFEYGYFDYSGNRSRGGNYVDGNGNTVRLTNYDTWNDRYAVGFTPDEDTLLEFSLLRSNGYMANATIHMDATVLDRENYAMRFQKQHLNRWLKAVNLQYNYTTVEHYMDDFTLRTQADRHNKLSTIIMAQDWEQNFVKGEATFALTPAWELITGAEYRRDHYFSGAAFGSLSTNPFLRRIIRNEDVPKTFILDFENFAGYAELAYQMNDNVRWVTGLRGDHLLTVTGDMRAGGQTSTRLLSGANQSRSQNLWAAFARAEYHFDSLPLQAALGYGHAERAADYWEVYSMDGLYLNAEKNNELDGKLTYHGEEFDVVLSGFYSRVDDFILVYRGASALNVDAERTGGELKINYHLDEDWTLTGNTAYTYAQNLTQNIALAQTPPLEGTIGIQYAHGPYRAQFNTRMVAEQTRIHPDYGNVLALDSTPTGGFMVASLQLGYQPVDAVKIDFGIDNLLDKVYSEHLNRIGSATGGFGGPAPVKLVEPGRMFWGRISIDFDY